MENRSSGGLYSTKPIQECHKPKPSQSHQNDNVVKPLNTKTKTRIKQKPQLSKSQTPKQKHDNALKLGFAKDVKRQGEQTREEGEKSGSAREYAKQCSQLKR